MSIGFWQIAIVVVLVLSKIGNWIGSIKRYFNSIQNEVTDIESDFEKEISIKEKYSKKTKINDENE